MTPRDGTSESVERFRLFGIITTFGLALLMPRETWLAMHEIVRAFSPAAAGEKVATAG